MTRDVTPTDVLKIFFPGRDPKAHPVMGDVFVKKAERLVVYGTALPDPYSQQPRLIYVYVEPEEQRQLFLRTSWRRHVVGFTVVTRGEETLDSEVRELYLRALAARDRRPAGETA